MLSGQLNANGIDVIHENRKLDHNIVVVNTCGFIDKAKEAFANLPAEVKLTKAQAAAWAKENPAKDRIAKRKEQLKLVLFKRGGEVVAPAN